MIVLLDTHALIWALEGGEQLSDVARKVIENTDNLVLASVVSGWEIAIKVGLGRLDAPMDLEHAVDDAGFTKRVLTFADVASLRQLTLAHRDPFDRMLIAQAMTDGVPIVTRDAQIARYPIQTIW